jgi:hypothetical protein
MTLHAAELYDAGKPCGAQANAAKYLAADAGFRASDRAIRTHGGMGYATEFHVERYFREMASIGAISRETSCTSPSVSLACKSMRKSTAEWFSRKARKAQISINREERRNALNPR